MIKSTIYIILLVSVELLAKDVGGNAFGKSIAAQPIDLVNSMPSWFRDFESYNCYCLSKKDGLNSSEYLEKGIPKPQKKITPIRLFLISENLPALVLISMQVYVSKPDTNRYGTSCNWPYPENRLLTKPKQRRNLILPDFSYNDNTLSEDGFFPYQGDVNNYRMLWKRVNKWQKTRNQDLNKEIASSYPFNLFGTLHYFRNFPISYSANNNLIVTPLFQVAKINGGQIVHETSVIFQFQNKAWLRSSFNSSNKVSADFRVSLRQGLSLGYRLEKNLNTPQQQLNWTHGFSLAYKMYLN